MSDNKLEFELLKSKKILQEICGLKVESICYPMGWFSKNVISMAKNRSYTKQYSSLPGSYYNEVYDSVKRRSLVQFSDETEFQSILNGGDNILNLWYKPKHFKRWEFA